MKGTVGDYKSMEVAFDMDYKNRTMQSFIEYQWLK